MKNVDLLTSNGVNINQSLEYLGDMEMYDEMLTDFLEEMENRVLNLDNYKTTNDMQNYAIMAHTIKGDSKYLGFEHLADLSYQHEIESKNNNVDFINNNYNELIEEIDRIIDFSKKYLNS